MKKCSRCGELKSENEFWKDSTKKDNLTSNCKECQKENSRKWYQENKEHKKEYSRKWREENPEYSKEYREEHKKQYNEYQQERRKNNQKYRLNNNISRAIRHSLNNGKSGRHWEDLVDYTLDDLKEHLEDQFENWMNWDNHGTANKDKKTWQIDHIKPVNSFDFNLPNNEEFKQCWALENLQPLEAIENLSKKNNY